MRLSASSSLLLWQLKTAFKYDEINSGLVARRIVFNNTGTVSSSGSNQETQVELTVNSIFNVLIVLNVFKFELCASTQTFHTRGVTLKCSGTFPAWAHV